VSDASKVAFATLAYNLNDWGYELIDCQVHSSHLASLGADDIPREAFAEQLNRHIGATSASHWRNQTPLLIPQ
ncbi:leucyl/phenylalanyl-tRNA--protein transferase, partial [Gilvimarinus sp. 1_MG-2023]|nr:leucyl/phenylalanyl-tRNA--protein transferase [Gilvimarinus sp. 1_MG-2023]